MRTLVVALSTLGILSVCFAIYQASMNEPGVATEPPPPRLPIFDAEIPPPTTEPTSSTVSDAKPANAGPGGADLGGAIIGRGIGQTLTIYDREGTKARWEISGDATPIPGRPNEFALTRPDVRTRTNSGHRIRARAERGVLEAVRTADRNLDLLRGRLSGNVVIEIDRLTEKERAALPEGERDRIDPSQIIRIEVDDIMFDREYTKVVVDGPLHLIAADADVRTSNVEIRFDENAGRVESCRIGAGGRIELRRQGGQWGVAMPGIETADTKQQSVGQWLGAAIQAHLAAKQSPSAAAATIGKPQPVKPESVTTGSEGRDVPVFRTTDTARKPDRPPVKYLARFEGQIDARQFVGSEERSHLAADALEILRDLTEQDRERMQQQASPAGPGAQAAPTGPEESMVLTWTDRLTIHAVDPQAAAPDTDAQPGLTATGTPVRLTSRQGDAVCRQLKVDADNTGVSLLADEREPVSVRLPGQGVLTGSAVFSEQNGDEWRIRVLGPGTLTRDAAPQDAGPDDAAPRENAQESVISFAEELEIFGRHVTTPAFSFVTGFSIRKYRKIDKAVFTGRTSMREGNTALDADKLTVYFGKPRGGLGQPPPRRVLGIGDVVLTQGEDRLTCDAIDLTLTTGPDGNVFPRRAITTGHVRATQGDRLVEAAQELIVDFELIEKAPEPFNPVKAYHQAVASGVDPSDIDVAMLRQRHQATRSQEAGISKLHAVDRVRIIDPTAELDLSAQKLDCTVLNGRDIDKAHVFGSETQPASVRIGALTVVGTEIHLDVTAERADVPVPGRMTFLSMKDLDGRKVDAPIPISITWEDSMRFRGADNEARFFGGVHATSESNTTFDCGELLIEFTDTEAAPPTTQPAVDWWIFSDLFDAVSQQKDRRSGPTGGRFSKEPSYIVAKDNPVAVTVDFDESTGVMISRARIAGPQLAVDLSADATRMLIEGAGNLLLEDFRDVDPKRKTQPAGDAALFDVGDGAGPSKTLIQWTDTMWYNYSQAKTRFQGDVQLKHFSGLEMQRRFGGKDTAGGGLPPGRSTFLQCNTLDVDFLNRDQRNALSKVDRMGGLSAGRLRRFEADGVRRLEMKEADQKLWITAQRLVFERDRDLLAIHGTQQKPAHIIRQQPGELPTDIKTRRAYYNTRTGKIEALSPTWQGR